MDKALMFSGLLRHFALTLYLNCRNKQALVYGYLVPVFFLVAFGSVFRNDSPLLLRQMGQLLTISILGGACFGLPTALVSERERGVWRRYRLLPVATGSLVIGTLAARLVIVATAVLLQIGLARLIYGTPLPMHPAQACVAFLFVACSFLGLGLVIAALADDVPAVQALGQCLFLPMIMIGGVAVPLTVLPGWAQYLAGFMPGRYAVEALQLCFTDPHGLRDAGFSLAALTVIGVAAGSVGARLFRWDAGQHASRSARAGVIVALCSWVVIGLTAALTGQLIPRPPEGFAYQNITEDEIGRITFDDLPGDNDVVTPLAASNSFAGSKAIEEFAARLRRWAPAHLNDPGQSIRNLVCVAAIVDLSQEPLEREMARVVLEDLRAGFDEDQLRHGLAWIVLSPDDGNVISNAPELGLRRHPPRRAVRERSALYARKFLGKVLGKISD